MVGNLLVNSVIDLNPSWDVISNDLRDFEKLKWTEETKMALKL